MLYSILKIPATISFWIYCRKLHVNNKEYFNANGPLLLACNHPNSFLDAIVLSSLFKRPIYSLARGDAFKNKFFGWILRSLKMLPVYRTSEGVENMEHNYTTFNACKEIFKKNGIVLIFSEGKCVNEWHLRPLKKGTARLAISSWNDGIDLTILPVGINYQSFRKFGKNIHLYFGKPIVKKDIDLEDSFGKANGSINQQLKNQLTEMVYEIEKNNKVALNNTFYVKQSLIKKIALFIPAVIGWLLHAPYYFPIKHFVKYTSKDNDHYDSIVVSIILLTYPFYLMLLIGIASVMIKNTAILALLILVIPFTAWAFIQLKKQIE